MNFNIDELNKTFLRIADALEMIALQEKPLGASARKRKIRAKSAPLGASNNSISLLYWTKSETELAAFLQGLVNSKRQLNQRTISSFAIAGIARQRYNIPAEQVIHLGLTMAALTAAGLVPVSKYVFSIASEAREPA